MPSPKSLTKTIYSTACDKACVARMCDSPQQAKLAITLSRQNVELCWSPSCLSFAGSKLNLPAGSTSVKHDGWLEPRVPASGPLITQKPLGKAAFLKNVLQACR